MRSFSQLIPFSYSFLPFILNARLIWKSKRMDLRGDRASATFGGNERTT